ncbi:glycosyltransferase family 2 protein [Stieleria sp. ICT_E10.1]|uniref:glycosyltransferase family 2 protein n=1 Tax=Stieleria sedimenti TaxID=2976331 RepID=UPI00218012E4|nr:glycosyltransferase family 2 protein [Stieleria sedimenti]MCS7466978.1 glycosyltransferase family 2 protein [Stieleria sedimenti]
MSNPTVSVVIPAYNASATIARAIDSCLAQTIPLWQIIVVDDGSSDGLAELVRTRYADSVTLIRQTNSRTAAARNRGLDAVTGDFVGFLDADDHWEPGKIERQLSIFATHPEVDVVAGRFFCQSPGSPRTLNASKSNRWYDRPVQASGADAFLLGTLHWTGTVLVRRSALGNLRFVSGLEPAEDRDLWIRLAANHPVYLDSEPLATAVLEPGSLSRGSIEVDCTKMLEVIQRHRSLLSLPARLFWTSYVRYRWAAMDPKPSTALPMLIRSVASWPFPFAGMPAMKRLGRLKRLLVLLRQSMMRPSQPEGVS